MINRYLLPLSCLFAAPVLANHHYGDWSGNVDFGYQNFTGNTDEESINSNIVLTLDQDAFEWTNRANMLYTEVDNVRSGEKYDFSTFLSYNFLPKTYVFGRIAYETDKFSGFDYQINYIAGLGWNLYDTTKFTWDAEIGGGYRTSKIKPPSTESKKDEGIGAVSTRLNYHLSDIAQFQQYASYETGKDIDITYSSSQLIIGLMENLALKLSYNIKHTSEVPVDTAKTDTETLISLSYIF